MPFTPQTPTNRPTSFRSDGEDNELMVTLLTTFSSLYSGTTVSTLAIAGLVSRNLSCPLSAVFCELLTTSSLIYTCGNAIMTVLLHVNPPPAPTPLCDYMPLLLQLLFPSVNRLGHSHGPWTTNHGILIFHVVQMCQ